MWFVHLSALGSALRSAMGDSTSRTRSSAPWSLVGVSGAGWRLDAERCPSLSTAHLCPGPPALQWEDVERWDPPSWQDEVGVRALEYSCWADVTDSGGWPYALVGGWVAGWLGGAYVHVDVDR